MMELRAFAWSITLLLLGVGCSADPALVQVQITTNLPTVWPASEHGLDPFTVMHVSADVVTADGRERVLDEDVSSYTGSSYLHVLELGEARYGVGVPLTLELHAVTAGKGELSRSFELALREHEMLRLDAYLERQCLIAPPSCPAGQSCGSAGKCQATDALLAEVPRGGLGFH